MDGRTSDGRTSDGRTSDGRSTDGRTTDGRPSDGRTTDSRTAAPSYPAPSYPAPSYPAPSYPASSYPASSYPSSSSQVAETAVVVDEPPRTPQPARSAPADQDAAAPRVARLTIASIDPWSVLKLSFLLSVAAGIALVVGVLVLWSVLDGIGVFDELNTMLGTIGLSTTTETFDIYKYVGLSRVLSIATVIGVLNAALLTALSTVTALLYNLSAGLVGGVRVTLSDD